MNRKSYCKATMRIINLQNREHLMVGSAPSPTIEDVNTGGLSTNPLNYSGGGANQGDAW